MVLRKRSPNVPPIPQPIDSGLPVDLAHKVTICHPGYRDAADDLISFAAFDGPRGGLFYDTALIACGIITANHWDGWFSKDIKGEEIISRAACEGVLPPGLYYFQLPTLNHQPYPVVPTFRHWQFPHQNLPPSWTCTSYTPGSFQIPTGARSDITLQLFFRDNGKCRMSHHEEGCEKAHLCPTEENEWFHRQRMERYIRGMGKTGDLAVDDVNNRVLLRADLHKTFDDNKFVFVPKDGDFVVHMLEPSSELTATYHNSRLHPLDFVPREYLFARFAWALFPFIEGFLQAGKDRWILPTNHTQADLISAAECKAMGSKKESRSRSPTKNNSPTKRARTEPNEDELEIEEDHLSHRRGIVNNKRIKVSKAKQDVQDECLPEGFVSGPIGECNHSSMFRSTQTEDFGCNGPQPTNKPQTSSANCPLSPQSLLPLDFTPSTANPVLQHVTEADDAGPALAMSPPESHTPPEPALDPMQEVEEDLRLRRVHYEALLRERTRSDKDGLWQKDLDWADGYLQEAAADVDGMQRLWWIYGRDNGDDR
ncbi:MAG: hypothetical protein Q9181_005386 [Wetmoreana brouardii]